MAITSRPGLITLALHSGANDKLRGAETAPITQVNEFFIPPRQIYTDESRRPARHQLHRLKPPLSNFTEMNGLEWILGDLDATCEQTL